MTPVSPSIIYKGKLIQIDLDNMMFLRDADRNWRKLPPPSSVIITQVPVKKAIGNMFGARSRHTYKEFRVYIKAGKLNIMAYKGSRVDVIDEGERVAAFLGIKAQDLIPRQADGSIEDDEDGLIRIINRVKNGLLILVALIFVFILVTVLGVIVYTSIEHLFS